MMFEAMEEEDIARVVAMVAVATVALTAVVAVTAAAAAAAEVTVVEVMVVATAAAWEVIHTPPPRCYDWMERCPILGCESFFPM